MAMAETRTFTVRDWFALAVGVSWGIVLGRFFGAGDMLGPWLVVLLGPPVMLLISPARPILGWQVPIVAAAASSALLYRDPQNGAGLDFLEAGLTWLMCSFLSSPWALIFHHRAKRANQQIEKQVSASYVGLGFLVFLACALTMVGCAGSLYSAGGRATAFYSFLMVTAGVGLSVVSFQIARKLDVRQPITDLLQLALLFPSIAGIILVAGFAYELFRSTRPGGSSAPIEVWSTLAGLEALLAMIWLVWKDRREQTRAS